MAEYEEAKWNAQEVKRLQADVGMYKAMKEGVAIRIADLEVKINHLTTIVNQLPKTADGMPIIPFHSSGIAHPGQLIYLQHLIFSRHQSPPFFFLRSENCEPKAQPEARVKIDFTSPSIPVAIKVKQPNINTKAIIISGVHFITHLLS